MTDQVDESIRGLRDLLYCDATLDQALVTFGLDEPLLRDAIAEIQQNRYSEARSRLEDASASQTLSNYPQYWWALAKARSAEGDLTGAREAALKVLGLPDLETRYAIQTWTVLRELGYAPDEKKANEVMGVVIEQGLDTGALIVAGFEDGDARLFWTTGGGILGDMRSIPTVADAARTLAATAQTIVARLPVETDRPLPAAGRLRFSMLTPGGMHAADQSEIDVGDPDNLLYPLLGAVFGLIGSMRTLVDGSKQREPS